MEYRVIEGNAKFIQDELNFLKEKWIIKVEGVSTSPRDVQLGIGGIVVLFTLDPLSISEEIDPSGGLLQTFGFEESKEKLKKAYDEQKITTEEKKEKIIKETKKLASKPAPKQTKPIKRNKK